MANNIKASANSKNFGYVRVSTTAQTFDRQVDALTEMGIDPADVYSDKISGTKQSRPGLDALLKTARSGDSITVHSLDRLGRSALHVMQTIADLEERGITIRSLKEGDAQYTGATGAFYRGLMILVAELERNMNAERVAEARAARRARSKAGEQVAGRPRTARDPKSVQKVLKHKERGMTVAEIVDATGMSRASVYRILADAA